MSRDLPGQGLLFPEDEPQPHDDGHAETVQPECMGCAPAALGLPNKATCTVGEAHRHTGFSVRQLRYFVADGTLLAVNAARRPVGKSEGRGGARRRGKLDSWRIVVRRTPAFMPDDYKYFQTLEEFILSRTNKEN